MAQAPWIAAGVAAGVAAGAADALAPGARKRVFVPGGEAIIVYHLASSTR